MADQSTSEFGISHEPSESTPVAQSQTDFAWTRLSDEDNAEIDKFVQRGLIDDRNDPIAVRCELAHQRFYPDFNNIDFDGMDDEELELFVKEHMDDINALAHGLQHKGVRDQCYSILSSISNDLLFWVDEEIRRAPLQTIYSNLSKLGDKLIFVSPKESISTASLWIELARYSDMPEVSRHAMQWLENVLDDPKSMHIAVHNIAEKYFPHSYDDRDEMTQFLEKLMRKYLDQLELPSEEMIDWWKDAGSQSKHHNTEDYRYDSRKVNGVFTNNIYRITDLESAQQGSAKELLDEFNIHNYGRYSTDLLLDQLKRKKEQGNSIICMVAKHDHNYAFGAEQRWMEPFVSGLHKVDPGIKFRIYEIDSKRSIIKTHVKEAKKSGPNIIGVIYCAHGEKDKFTLSDQPKKSQKPSEEVQIDDIPVFAAHKMRDKYFDPDCTPFVILNSCSIDQKFGPHIRSVSDALVLAADERVSLDKISATKDLDGKMQIHVQWHGDSGFIEKATI